MNDDATHVHSLTNKQVRKDAIIWHCSTCGKTVKETSKRSCATCGYPLENHGFGWLCAANPWEHPQPTAESAADILESTQLPQISDPVGESILLELRAIRALLEWQKDCMSTSDDKQNAAAWEMFEEMIQKARQEYATIREQERLEHEMLYHRKGPAANA